MTQEQIQQQALQIYAALGELSVKRKQQIQIVNQIDAKVNELEAQLVELSKVEVESESSDEE